MHRWKECLHPNKSNGINVTTPRRHVVFCTVSCMSNLTVILYFRPLIHAAHREGERDVASRREFSLLSLLSLLHRLYICCLHIGWISWLFHTHTHRLFYKRYCRSSWPVTVLSTSPESSKKWTLLRSWRTGELLLPSPHRSALWWIHTLPWSLACCIHSFIWKN